MPRQTIPAPGYTRISGSRAPPKAWGDKLWVQIRGDGVTAGWVDVVPWLVKDCRWIHDGTAGDIVAVKRVE